MEVLYEDNHLIIVNKKSGEIVQGDRTGDRTLAEKVKNYIKKKYNKPGNVFIGTTHRLDRPVSGAIIFAKTSKALTRLNAQFQQKEIQKTYWALCLEKPVPSSGSLVHYLIKDAEKNKTAAYLEDKPSSKKAELHYQYLKKQGRHYLVEVNPLTGRPHQIRIQLSTIGCTIKGDLKYGAHFPNKDKSICLHSRKVEFIHPVSKEKIAAVAPLLNESLWD